MLFQKCYTVLSEEVSWDTAYTNCSGRNEHLVTIASRTEMKYIQYLLRHQLFNKKNTTLKDKVDKQKVFGAHIGNSFLSIM
jgi:hypothetical protein